MINFPVLKRLTIEGYLLYPGTDTAGVLEINFQKGPTLIAGVNGLGKSTLVTVLLRLLTGPYDLPNPSPDGDLLEGNPKPRSLKAERIFAPRVADSAKNAKATLKFSIAGEDFTITRKLGSLEIVEFLRAGTATADISEEFYQESIKDSMSLGSFFDVLLVLQYIVFFMEERRALVWGKTAQREILRALFLTPDMASEVSNLRYKMTSADSSYRNTRSTLGRRISQNEREITRHTSVPKVQASLAVKDGELRSVNEELEKINAELIELEEDRASAILSVSRTALKRDSTTRELERAKVNYLTAHFSDLDDSSIYILSKLINEDHCLACDSDEEGLSQPLLDRIENNRCVVCGTEQEAIVPDDVIKLTPAKIEELQNNLNLLEKQHHTSKVEIEEIDQRYSNLLEFIDEGNKRRSKLVDEVTRLRRQLPQSDDIVSTNLEQRNKSFRETIEEEKLEYERCRADFESALANAQKYISQSHNDVAFRFKQYAQKFLKESCEISFDKVKVRIGQSGALFEVGLFQLSMSGGAIAGETSREDPDAVSMSQREFLDLAFRMALISVASQNSAATIIVDTPESSLDFLFARRAGDQLATFAREGGDEGHRVIVTSNLSNAHLVPAFLGGRPKGTRASNRVVNLLDLASPTAALNEDHEEYQNFLTDLIKRSENGAEA